MQELLRRLGVATQGLRESLPAITGVLDAFPEHVAILDGTGSIVATNAHWRAFLERNGGQPAACAEGASYLECCRRAALDGAPEAADVLESLDAILAGALSEYSRPYSCHAPGEERWFVLRMTAFSIDGQRHVLVTHENITRLKLSQDAADLLAMVASRTANGVIVTSADQSIEWVNQSFLALTGYSFDEVVGRRPSFLQGEGSEGPALERVRRACQAGEPVTATLLNYKRSREPFWVELRIDPVRDAAGRLTHFIAIQKDVSDARERDEDIARAAQAERERFAAELHDGLGQELTGAALLARAALEELPPESSSAESLRRALAAVNRALSAARELAQGLAPAHVANGLVPSLQALANHLTIPGTLEIRVVADAALDVRGTVAHQLFRVAQEAVSNAVRHAHARRITVEIAARRMSLELRVRDDGVGISPGAADGPTAGMGLRLMRHRAHALNGDVTLARDVGGGTVLTCTVPFEAGKFRRRRANA